MGGGLGWGEEHFKLVCWGVGCRAAGASRQEPGFVVCGTRAWSRPHCPKGGSHSVLPRGCTARSQGRGASCGAARLRLTLQAPSCRCGRRWTRGGLGCPEIRALGLGPTDRLLDEWPGSGPEVRGAWEPAGEVSKRWPPGPLPSRSGGRKWGAEPAWEAVWLAWAVWSAGPAGPVGGGSQALWAEGWRGSEGL